MYSQVEVDVEVPIAPRVPFYGDVGFRCWRPVSNRVEPGKMTRFVLLGRVAIRPLKDE